MINSFLNNIDSIARDHGLYGSVITLDNGEDDMYIVLSTEPISDKVNPKEICKSIHREPDLFHPKEFSIKANSDNIVVAINEAIDYLRDAEFLKNLYKEYDAVLPDRIRYSELSGLKNWCEGRANPNAPVSFALSCEKGLKLFFKHEKSSYGQEKRSFFRSERYDEDASYFQRQSDFNNRDSSIVRLPVLLKSSTEIGKKMIGSYFLNNFISYMEDMYPEVLFSLSDKEVIDNGLLEYARKAPEDDRFLTEKPVTDAEFQQIIRKRFADEGFDCTEGIKPAHWEFYNIYYKKADEAEIITAYNEVTLRFAEPDQLSKLTWRGEINMIDIPVDNIHQFVALAKANDVPFYIDIRGDFATPSFTDIHVMYSVGDKEKMIKIVDEMILRGLENSHIMYLQKGNGTLNNRILSARDDACRLSEPSHTDVHLYEK